MRAMLLHELGGRLTPGEVPMPRPGPNEALVRVRAVGVGLTLAMWGPVAAWASTWSRLARLCGGRVLVVDLGPEKLAMAKEVGADATIDAAAMPDWMPEVLAWTEGRGVDAAIDLVATAVTLPMCLAALARAGRLVIVGNRPKAVFRADPTFPVDPGTVLYKGLEIHGSRYVSMAELAQTLEIVRQGRVRPVVTRTFPLEGAEEALRLVEEGRVVGRAALVLD